MKFNKEYNPLSISRKADGILNIILAVVSLTAVIPFILVFIISITDETTLLNYGYSFLPQKFSFSAYRVLFSDTSGLANSYKVTIFVTFVGTILATTITGFYGYAISRKSFKYRKFFTFYIFFTMLFSGGLVPSYILITRYLHLRDKIWVLIIPGLFSAWNAIMMRTFFSTSIPESVVESAKIDGAGELRIFFSIVFPMSLPIFATIALFNCLGYWNDWYLSLLYIDNTKLVSLQFLMYRVMRNIQYIRSMVSFNPDIAKEMTNMPTETMRMAMAIMGIGPILIAYPFFQKYFVKGLVVGSIKE